MPYFKYQARDQEGKSSTGEADAASASALASQLLAKGLTPIKIEETKKKGTGGPNFKKDIIPPKVKTTDLVVLCRQLYSLSKAGVPIMNILRRLAETARNSTLQKTLNGIADKISGGQTFANALSSYPKIFPPVFISIVRAGEDSGQLEGAYLELAQYLENEQKTVRRIKAAIRYPIIVITAILIALIIINVFVIPNFAKMFTSFHAELPLPTRILLGFSGFLVTKGKYLAIGVVIFVIVFKRYIKTKEGRYRWDKFKLKMPIIGNILHRAYIGRFCRGFSLMINAGVPLVKAVSLVANVVGNSYVGRHLEAMCVTIGRGEPLTNAATETKLFSPLALQMLSVGEESGTLDEMLQQVAQFYESEVEYDLSRLDQLLEPIMLGIMGAMVLMLAVGVYLPMWSMTGFAHQQ